ncbi:glycerophosphodiester phosphodiesterase family protein [Algoriphagus kandeliae]|uniref:Glycerophosphodiester phosphodiesterase family protein n=1 Tax=Algoriphagus kandeliae TaxID=2562278 RepID=A0A4Y9QMP5_9BACT|nr:glycerophosphodiester phosphodiesterase family protein [Algoriphagus kandeliae]TFV93500.1 glycerophosphodiester phosphodiesterase family protein [Algoriphagus kandeliae]
MQRTNPKKEDFFLFRSFFFLALALLISSISSGQSLSQKLSENSVSIVSHRGVIDGETLENSLLGIKMAYERGIDFFEIDVRKGGNGELYLLHDATLDRTTNGKGPLENKSTEELQQIKLTGSGEFLPKFSQLLEFAQENQIYLMLDIKEPILQEVMGMVRDFGLSDRCLVLTFARDRASEARQIPGDFLISVLVNGAQDLNYYQGLFSDRDFLAYVSKEAPIELYQLVRDQSIPIVTDVMGAIDEQAQIDKGKSYQSFQEDRQAAVIVSDFPILLRNQLN